MNFRIQHVSLPRPPGSDDQTRAFYGGLLNLTEIPSPRALSGVIWYRLGDVELHLFEQAADDGPLNRHVCFEVDDVRALREMLEASDFATKDTTPIPGRPRFFCRDPFGNRLEFTQIEGDYIQLR
jgi:catechol 2,3-dioxygenase-like lactoylglutathione lyase family enzyme